MRLDAASTVVSVNAATSRHVRKTHNAGTTNDHLETLLINGPRDGYTFRVPGTAATDDNMTVNIRDFIALNLRGIG